MGRRHSDDLRSQKSGELASPFGPARIPDLLLPFEKQLAASIGLTEAEYVAFKRELEKNAKPRPAEYAGIPDIRNGATTIGIVSIVVGILTTVASALLAPKPQGVDERRDRSIRLSDINGPTRYNSSYGFDSIGEIATWTTLVPIPFGKFVDYSGTYSGGIIVTPSLVWSRLFSYGKSQIAKLLFVGGEQGCAIPDPECIYFGTLPLTKLSENNYAVYYRNGPGINRIKAADFKAGTRGTPDSGDPQQNDDIFSCPTDDAEVDTGFCYSYTPAGDTAFGVYNVIPNGTIQRVNWRVVSLPDLDNEDQEVRPKAERNKICGKPIRGAGMPGVGRSYGRQMGVTAYKAPNASGWTKPSERTQVQMDVGYRVQFLISNDKFEIKFDPEEGGVNSEDLQSTSRNDRARADDLLPLGETIQMGRMTWVVRSRSQKIWTEDSDDQIVELEAIQRFGTPFITVVPENMVRDTNNNVLAVVAKPGENLTATNHVGLAASAVSHQAMGLIRPTRQSDLIEIGIRSQVWQRFNGLCNFQEIPEPDELLQFDEDQVNISNGVMSTYATRSSCFTIKVRRAGLDTNGNAYPWAALSQQFVVTGNAPVDQYNYIRLYFPFRFQKYEVRLEPLPGDIAIREFTQDEVFEQLDAGRGEEISITSNTSYGNFVIKYTGRRVAHATLLPNPETFGKTRGFGVSDSDDGATQVSITSYEVDGTPSDHGNAHGWRNEVLGFAQLYKNQTRSRVIYKTIGTKSVGIEVTCTSVPGRVQASKPGYSPELYTNWRWDQPRLRVVSSTSGWRVGDTFVKGYSITSDPATFNNKWLAHAYAKGSRTIFANIRIDRVGEPTVDSGEIKATTRPFASSSQLADVDYYPGLITRSNESNPEHSVVYVSEMVDNDTAPSYFNMSMFGLSVRSSGRLTNISQVRYWIPGGVKVYRTAPDAVLGETGSSVFEETDRVGRSNLFTDLIWYLLTDKDAGAGDVVQEALLNEEQFETTSRFLARNKIFCDTVIQDQVNIREYATRVAPMMLCNFAIQDGRFSLIPAVPVDASGRISEQAVPISAQFTAGNIIEDSFQINYLGIEERAPFKASATYRIGMERQLPEEANVFVRYAGSASQGPNGDNLEGTVPLEEFPMAEWCTQKEQAVLACKYMLALRKHVTHTVSFTTSPEGLSLAPGDYIKVNTISNPFRPRTLGSVSADGLIKAVEPMQDGEYRVVFYRPGAPAPEYKTIVVRDGRTEDLENAVFSWYEETNRSGVYLVEQLTINEEGLVEVVGSSFPVDENGVSRINQDILQADGSDTWVVSE